MKIRFAATDDLQRIVEIYNQAIASGKATADLTEVLVDEKQEWFNQHNENDYPLYVIEVENKIIGWGSLSKYRNGREALKSTAEISYYIDYNYHNKGYGKELIDFIIKDCKRLKINNLFALLLEINKASVNVLEKFGFVKWGFMPGVVNINGKICGHLIYGKNLS